MVITLKNGKKIKLEWNLLCVEYIDEYPGGMAQIQEDMKHKIHMVKTINTLISSVIRANYETPLSRDEAVCLVKYEDYDKILEFLDKECELLENYKKKETSFHPNRKKKGRR